MAGMKLRLKPDDKRVVQKYVNGKWVKMKVCRTVEEARRMVRSER